MMLRPTQDWASWQLSTWLAVPASSGLGNLCSWIPSNTNPLPDFTPITDDSHSLSHEQYSLQYHQKGQGQLKNGDDEVLSSVHDLSS